MKERDLSVYDFKEEDEMIEPLNQWSKLSNPKFDHHHDDPPITKYHFLQHTSSGSISQMKAIHTVEQIHVVAIDDDDRGFVNDISGDPQGSPDKASSKQSEFFGDISDRILEQHCHFSGDRVRPKSSSLDTEDSVRPKSSSLDTEIGISCPFGLPTGNGRMAHISPTIPESPCSNGSVDGGASDGYDSIHESSPSVSGSEHEENTVPMDGQAHDQPVSGWDMEKMDTALHADYVSYGNKYFPACEILFLKTSLKVEASGLEEASGESMPEWKVDDILSIESQWSHWEDTAKVKVRLLTKDEEQAENAHATTGVGVLEFVVHDPHWLQRQEAIMSLDLKYQAAWNIRLNGKICDEGPFSFEDSESSIDPYIPKFEEPFDEVVYPKGDADAVSISKRDVDLLEPEIFLNDTIIDFYMKYLKNELASSEKRRFHFFNSFFFRKLADPDKNPSGVFDGKAGFQRVRKWTRKVNIFEKDYIFIPVNYNLHWSLIVICHPGEVANFNDENIDESVKVPCILHMDSIRGSHAGLKDLVQSYLLEEWKEKQKEASEDIVSKFLNLRFLSLELPQQENCSDCGLFLLHYAELFIAEAPENFSPFQINKFDNFLKPDWFVPAEASIKRVHIQRLIYELLEGRPLVNGSPCNRKSQPSALPENHQNDTGLEIISERRSPRKSWNSLHSQSVHGMDIGLLDMSLYRTPECTNASSLEMTELYESQHYSQELSFGRPGCPLPPIREEVGAVDHLAPELQPLDDVVDGACHIGYTPGDFNSGFRWNPGLSDQGDAEDNSSPSSHGSSDDSEEMIIIECEQAVQSGSGLNKNSDQQKENVDSLTESYASASSDMMETPAEDSQELAKIYGNNDLEDSHAPNQEEQQQEEEEQEVEEQEEQEVEQEEQKQEQQEEQEKEGKEPSHQELEKLLDDGHIIGVNEVVEDSDSDMDEEQAPKRIRLTPSGDGERELVRSLSKELQV